MLKLELVTRKDGTQYYKASGDCEVSTLVAFAEKQLGSNIVYRVSKDTNYIVGETRKRAVIQIKV